MTLRKVRTSASIRSTASAPVASAQREALHNPSAQKRGGRHAELSGQVLYCG
jgi:hypothetical protein